MSPEFQQLLAMVIPVVVAILTVPLFNLLQQASALIDRLPPTVKRLVLAVVVAVFNWLTVLIGIAPSQSPTGLSQTAVGTVLSALLAYLLHAAGELKSVNATSASIAAHVGAAPPPKS